MKRSVISFLILVGLNQLAIAQTAMDKNPQQTISAAQQASTTIAQALDTNSITQDEPQETQQFETQAINQAEQRVLQNFNAGNSDQQATQQVPQPTK